VKLSFNSRLNVFLGATCRLLSNNNNNNNNNNNDNDNDNNNIITTIYITCLTELSRLALHCHENVREKSDVF